MSDILYRFLVMARRRDRSPWRRLFLVDEPLLESGVEQLVESAAARVVVTSQHERVSRKKVTVPASRHRQVRFHETVEPNRPTPDHFERRKESFPLAGTLQIYTCAPCSGRGRVTCGSCFGQGQARCGGCGGSGKVRDHRKRRQTCGSCGGSGNTRCSSCRGSGDLPCRTCSGEGQMANWEEEIYDYRIENRTGDQYPLARPPAGLRGTFAKWLKIDQDIIADFAPTTAIRHLGFETPEALDVAARAQKDRQRLEESAQGSKDRYLFHKTARSLSPIGYSVARRAGRAFYYWLVGRGDRALEIQPAGRVDGRKCGGWLGLTSLCLFGYEALLRLFEPADLLSMVVLVDLPPPALAAGIVAGGALALSGLLRWLKRPATVETVGFFHQTGQPTSLLTCLAYLGSYTGRLSVVDRTYGTQTKRLLGTARPDRQSESLAVELADGRKVYLIEVAHPQGLSDPQLASLLKSLDGVVILKEAGLKETQKEGAEFEGPTFEPRIRMLAEETTRITTARINREVDLKSLNAPDSLPLDSLPLEAIRNAFLGHFQADVDWHELFAKIWRPLAEALGDDDVPHHESPSPESLTSESPGAESLAGERRSTSHEISLQLEEFDHHESRSHEPVVEDPEPLHIAS